MINLVWKPRCAGSSVLVTTYKYWTVEHYTLDDYPTFMAHRGTAEVIRAESMEEMIKKLDKI